MIINKKNNDLYNKSLNDNNTFQKNFNLYKEESEKMQEINPFKEDIKSINHSNPLSKNDMRKKSVAMLQERLDNGLISLEEFNKKCKDLWKK